MDYRIRTLILLLLVSGSMPIFAVECSIGNLVLHSQEEVDNFQEAHGPCDQVRGNLTLSGETIVDLSPLSGLVEVKGDLSFGSNLELRSLSGLSNLRSVYMLRLSNNEKLIDLSGLTSLETLWIGMIVYKNNSLRTLEGMPALRTIGLMLEIAENPNLLTLYGLRHTGFVYDAEIKVTGNDKLLNLVGLPVATRVSRLIISGNARLGQLNGLQVEDGTLVGLVSIQNHPALRNLEGMEWLKSTLSLYLFRNEQMENLTGLSGLTQAEQISITENDSLESLAGLENLHSVMDLPGGLPAGGTFTGQLWLKSNPALDNLDALTRLTAVGSLWVSDNVKLSECSGLEALLDVIDHEQPGPGLLEIPDVAGSVNIYSNADDCNTIGEIAPKPDVVRLLTGSWYSPETSGEGFMIHAVSEHVTPIAGVRPGQTGLAVGYFYGFDPSGERFWLIGVHEGPMNWGEPIEFVANEVAGGQFEGFDPESIERYDWGTFSFTPKSCVAGDLTMKGEFAIQPGVQERALEVTRLANVSGDYCSDQVPADVTDSITGSWYDPITSGQGFSIHKINEELGIAYFYGFDASQAPLWLIGVWTEPSVVGETVEMEMTQVSGGTFIDLNPMDIVREPWGTLKLRLDECFNAFADLDGQDGRQVFWMNQLAGSLSLDCEN